MASRKCEGAEVTDVKGTPWAVPLAYLPLCASSSGWLEVRQAGTWNGSRSAAGEASDGAQSPTL